MCPQNISMFEWKVGPFTVDPPIPGRIVFDICSISNLYKNIQ